MSAFLKNNFVLVVGVCIPLLCILLVVVAVLVPSLFVKPHYDFLYTMTTSSPVPYGAVTESYTIVNGKLVLTATTPAGTPAPLPAGVKAVGADVEGLAGVASTSTPALYVYDVKNDSSTEISLADAQKLTLIVGPTSPDGYTVEQGSGDGSGLFDLFGGYDNGYDYVITKGDSAKELRAIGSGPMMYDESFDLIGWIQ